MALDLIEPVVARGSLDELKAVYVPGLARTWRPSSSWQSDTLLHVALGRHDKEGRIGISNFLLDDGADATYIRRRNGSTHTLGLLIDRADLAASAQDVALFRRLLDAGADINAVDKKYGTPVQWLGEKLMNVDESLGVPFYDVIFARVDLDLFKIGAGKKSSYRTAELDRDYFAKLNEGQFSILWTRVQQYVREHGLVVPEVAG
jgi:hypothetical protein